MNAGQHVPLRVVYDKEGYQQLIAAVSSGSLAAEDRVGLLLDAYSLCKAGHPAMDVGQLLALVEAYKNEDDATVRMFMMAECEFLTVFFFLQGVAYLKRAE